MIPVNYKNLLSSLSIILSKYESLNKMSSTSYSTVLHSLRFMFLLLLIVVNPTLSPILIPSLLPPHPSQSTLTDLLVNPLQQHRVLFVWKMSPPWIDFDNISPPMGNYKQQQIGFRIHHFPHNPYRTAYKYWLKRTDSIGTVQQKKSKTNQMSAIRVRYHWNSTWDRSERVQQKRVK